MNSETLITDPVYLSIALSKKYGVSAGLEFDRICRCLQSICARKSNHLFFLFGRAHQIDSDVLPHGVSTTNWSPSADGRGGMAQIILIPCSDPKQRIRLEYKLTWHSTLGHGRLDVSLNPTTILVGNNVHPATTANPKTGEIPLFPSSSPDAMNRTFCLGFNVLEELHAQLPGTHEPLFDPATQAVIRSGQIHIVHAQWSAYLPSPDTARFLQVTTALYEHTIAKNKTIINIADQMGLKFESYVDDDGNLTGLMLRKRHGKKPVFSLVFYDKRKRIADMKQGKTLVPAERSTVDNNIRFDITAHSEGIVMMVKAARRRLKELKTRGAIPAHWKWSDAFSRSDITPTVWYLKRAIFILSHVSVDGKWVRRSFTRWLVPYMLKEVLRFDVIAGFKQHNLNRLCELEDSVAAAWLEEQEDQCSHWATRIAESAGCAVATVYSRRKQWLQEYGIDILLPYGVYRDLLYFGPSSLTSSEHRTAFLSAVEQGKGNAVIRMRKKAATRFNSVRKKVVHSTITSRPLSMRVKTPLEVGHQANLVELKDN
jgi:hypothetical protein